VHIFDILRAPLGALFLYGREAKNENRLKKTDEAVTIGTASCSRSEKDRLVTGSGEAQPWNKTANKPKP
jgi:hypothetical protein